MIKLVPAKCPSCGGDLQVNEKLEKTICQYCGTTVLIDEAIKKYKVEFTGKVKVSKDYSDKIDTAKKYLKIKKYEPAKRVIDEVLREDELNLEAMKMRVELDDLKLSAQDLNSEDVILNNDLQIGFQLKDIKEIYELDEENIYKEELEPLKTKYEQLSKRMKELIELRTKLINKCNEYCNHKYKNLITLLKALKIDEKKYGKSFGIFGAIEYWDDGWIRHSFATFHPKIIWLCSDKINIVHDFDATNNKEVKNADVKIHNSYSFIREEKISLSEQIQIVDELIKKQKEKPTVKTIFNKIFKK